jgi:hypothetical protein
LDWSASALGDDDSLEKFFVAIPGFLDSKLVNDFRERLPDNLMERLRSFRGASEPYLVIKLSHWISQTSSARHFTECNVLDTRFPCLVPPQQDFVKTLESSAPHPVPKKVAHVGTVS